MLSISSIASLFSLLTYKLLQYALVRYLNLRQIRVGRPALTEKESFEGGEVDKRQLQLIDARAKQQRALQDFFRDTGGKITDLRVLRSAMFLSDEIDRAVRGIDQEEQYVGWRQYNRFYAQGTEDMFTNIPTGRSPLVMAAPKTRIDLLQADEQTRTLPIEFQAVRKSHLKQVGRALDEIEQSELLRIAEQEKDIQNKLTQTQRDYIASKREQMHSPQQQLQNQQRQELGASAADQLLIIPRNDKISTHTAKDVKQAVYQPFEPYDKAPLKQRLVKFEGELNERRPDLDYKFEE